MLTLGNPVANVYVTVAVTVAPVAGSTRNGAFSCTVCASTIAATKRISPPPEHTAWPAVSPCGAPNPIRPGGKQRPVPRPRRCLVPARQVRLQVEVRAPPHSGRHTRERPARFGGG